MTTLSDIFDPSALDYEVQQGYVKVGYHPSLPLRIFTYTRECQYEGRWNSVTTQCRGLIADNGGTVIARPFPKFFNVGEHGVRDYAPPLPVEPFRVYSKVDGSLGIVFHYQDAWRVASKGSFVSEQAIWAQNWIDRRAKHALNIGWTYCAEIIYPENRIVVNYGDREDLMLLAAFRTDGYEIPLDRAESTWHLGDVVGTHDAGTLGTNLERVVEATLSNRRLDGTEVTGTDEEGYVIRFVSGIRAKCKFAEYTRLHRLLTGVTERNIWQAYAFDDMSDLGLSDDQLSRALKCSVQEVQMMRVAPHGAVQTIVEGCPDEFDDWVQSVIRKLQQDYDDVDVAAESAHDVIAGKVGTSDRGAFARELNKWYGDRKTVVSACFAMLDRKPFGPVIWRSLYPAASLPFREDELS